MLVLFFLHSIVCQSGKRSKSFRDRKVSAMHLKDSWDNGPLQGVASNMTVNLTDVVLLKLCPLNQ